MTYHKSRMPEEQWQIRVLKNPFTALERQALEAEFPEFKSLDRDQDRLKVVRSVWEKASKKSDDLSRAAGFVLKALAPSEPMISRLRELGRRPDGVFPLEYGDGFAMRLEHAAYLLVAAQWLDVHADASLVLGRSEVARDDVGLIFRLADALKRDPVLLSVLVEVSVTKLAARIIDQGIKLHAWSEDDFQEFDRILSRIDLPPRMAVALRFERASMIETTVPLLKKMGPAALAEAVGSSAGERVSRWLNPTFWFYRSYWLPGDQAFYCRSIQPWGEALDAVPSQGMRAEQYPNFVRDYLEANPSLWAKQRKILSVLALPSLTGSYVVVANAQTRVFQTRVAIALERYKMKNGQYPESLNELIPGVLATMPLDLTTLRPFLYRKIESGKFLLWSVGWNEIDESGKLERQNNKGDWVWGE